MWLFAKRIERVRGRNSVISGRVVVMVVVVVGDDAEEEERNSGDVERAEIRRGGAQMGESCEARSTPDAELPTMRTF